MTRDIIEFGKRMDTAEDKALLVESAEGAKFVLDLGAGTGKISRDIANLYGAKVDAVDIQFKDYCENTENVTYYGMSISDFLQENYEKKKYDCVVLSAILHELSEVEVNTLCRFLPNMMSENCRILIREPFFDKTLGPVLEKDSKEFIDLVATHIRADKAVEFVQTLKKSDDSIVVNQAFETSTDWANLAFTISYGEQSWNREKYELRYARSLNWCKQKFNFWNRPYTGFQVYSIKDNTYRKHFINAGIPCEAFDKIQYTGMLIVVDYSKVEK